jgi:hypothetical protein
MRCALGLLIALAISGCAGMACKTDVLHQPDLVEVETRIFVPIDPALTTQHEIAAGPIRECLTIAAERGRQLRLCNADKAAIRALQGTPVAKPEKEPEQ